MPELIDLLPEGYVAQVAERLDRSPEKITTAINERIGSVEKAVDSWFSAEKRLSTSINPVSDKSTPSEVADFRTKIGAPENAEGYAIAEKTDAATKAVLESLRPVADSTHLTTPQWDAVAETIAKARGSARESVEDHWKAGLGDLSENQRALAERGRQQLLSAEASDFLTESGLWNDPRLQRYLADAAAVSAQTTISAATPTPTMSSSKEIDSKIADIRADEDYQKGERYGGSKWRIKADELTELYKAKSALG